jgi:tRNA (cmo5U34)-methyltransferase
MFLILVGAVIILIFGKDMPKILFTLWEFYILYFYGIVVCKKLWQTDVANSTKEIANSDDITTIPVLEEMSDFFNSRAGIYDEKHIEHIGGGMESKNIIPSFFPPHTRTMIDLGIGTGLELEAIFKRFPEIEITGLDIAENMLKILLEKYPDKKIRLHCESYLYYDLGHCLYDVALSVMTLHHYNYPTKKDLYRRIYNCVKPNGMYIECDYMLSAQEYDNPQEQEDLHFLELARLKKEQGITGNREYHYDTPCTVSNQQKMLLEAGFGSVKEVWRKGQTVILIANK